MPKEIVTPLQKKKLVRSTIEAGNPSAAFIKRRSNFLGYRAEEISVCAHRSETVKDVVCDALGATFNDVWMK